MTASFGHCVTETTRFMAVAYKYHKLHGIRQELMDDELFDFTSGYRPLNYPRQLTGCASTLSHQYDNSVKQGNSGQHEPRLLSIRFRKKQLSFLPQIKPNVI
jgi:hypothetical protein